MTQNTQVSNSFVVKPLRTETEENSNSRHDSKPRMSIIQALGYRQNPNQSAANFKKGLQINASFSNTYTKEELNSIVPIKPVPISKFSTSNKMQKLDLTKKSPQVS